MSLIAAWVVLSFIAGIGVGKLLRACNADAGLDLPTPMEQRKRAWQSAVKDAEQRWQRRQQEQRL